VSDSCIFCRIVRREIPASIVNEDDDVLAFKDVNPQAPTHVLVVPKKHVATLGDVTPEDAPLAGRWFQAVRKTAGLLGLTDYRIVLNNGEGGGQAVFHVHFHILAGRRFHWPPG